MRCKLSSYLLLLTKTLILGLRNILEYHKTRIKRGSINAYCKANCINVLQIHVCILIGQFWPWHLAYKGHRTKAMKLKLVGHVSATNVQSEILPNSADFKENQTNCCILSDIVLCVEMNPV